MEKEKLKSKKLYVNAEKETHLNFNLCVVLRPELHSWFYENFINIAIYGDSQYIIDFLENSPNNSCSELMSERIIYDYDYFPQNEDIINYLINSINKDFYSAVWVDKYYIPNNESYMKWHFVHGIMVYGYDDINKTISFVNFSFEKGIILQEISYDEFIQAFINGKKYYKYGGGIITLIETVASFKVKSIYPNNVFELDRYMSELCDYLNSTVNISKLRRIDISSNDVIYGISVYDKFIDLLTQFNQENIDKVIPFKCFGDVCLHKEYMYDRLIYINNNYEITSECREKIEEFKKVSDLWKKAKSLNIKYNVLDGRMAATFSKNPKFILKFIEILRDAQNNEKELLGYIYHSLRKYALPKDKMQNTVNKNDYHIKYFEFYEENKVRIILSEPTLIESIAIMDNNTILNNDGIKKIHFNDESEITFQGQQYNILHKNHIIFKPQKVEWFEYSEINFENPFRDIRKLDFYIYKPSNKVLWNFTSSRYLYCERKTDIQFSEFESTILQNETNEQKKKFKIIENDPNITYDINFDADKLKYIYIKYNVSCLSETAQLFFSSYDYPILSEIKSKVFTISPNDKSFEYILDMSDNERWSGIVKQLRFDPVSYDNKSEEGECIVEYIEINDRIPVYGSKKDYMKTQGINGWSYHTYNNGITYREMIWNDQKETWIFANDENILISSDIQTSKNHIGTVRRWTCPADGRYLIKYDFTQQINKNNSDKERLTHFIFRQNHKIKEKNIYDKENQSFAGNYEIEMDLETGEVLNFEFYNGNENTTEIIEITISIKKCE